MVDRKQLSATLAASLFTAMAAAACEQIQPRADVVSSPAQFVRFDSTEGPLPLLVSHQTLMAGLIDWSAFGVLLLATGDQPMNDDDWVAASLAAVNLIASSTLLSIPGSGPDDHLHVEAPEWRGMVRDFQDAGLDVARAVQAHDRAAFSASAGRLADSCKACHDRFKRPSEEGETAFAQR
jgi:hypothetical protein